MNRRKALALLGGVFVPVSGCSNIVTPSRPEPVEVISKQIDKVDAGCVEEGTAHHRTSVSYQREAHRLDFEGTTIAERPCSELALLTETGRGDPDVSDYAVIVDVDVPYGGECDECTAEIDYEATIEFNRDPHAAYVNHIVKVNSEWKRVGPIETWTN